MRGGGKINITSFSVNDITFGKALTDEANWCRTRAAWEGIVRAEPRGIFKATYDGLAVGTGGVAVYGNRVAWIHSILVRKEFRKFGIGTALTQKCIQYADELGIPTIKLDATPIGLGIYKKLGFVEEFESTRFLAKGSRLGSGTAVSKMRPADFKEICELDEEMTGMARRKVLQAVFDNNPEFAFQARDSGRLTGFIMADRAEGRVEIGPCVASPEDRVIVRDLFAALLGVRPDEQYRLCIAGKLTKALTLALELGFERQLPSSTRMYKGDKFEETEAEWAMISPAKG